MDPFRFIGPIVSTRPGELLHRWQDVSTIGKIEVAEALTGGSKDDLRPTARGETGLRRPERRGKNSASRHRGNAGEQFAPSDHGSPSFSLARGEQLLLAKLAAAICYSGDPVGSICEVP